MNARSDYRDALRSARRMHASGGGTVLDVLLRSTPREDWPEMAAWLLRDAGVRAVWLTEGLTSAPDVIDAASAARLGCAALRITGEAAPRIALADPWDDERVQRVSTHLGAVPLLAAATSALLDSWGSGAMPAGSRFDPALPGLGGPVVDFVDAAVRGAYAAGASDVHFECDRAGVTVKFRLDGVMQRYARLDDPLRAEQVLSRIKVLAQLDITERRTPQDGRFRLELGGVGVDLRVSIMPSVFGEDAVLRLLDKAQLRGAAHGVSLMQLGFSDAHAAGLRGLAELPHGMLLATGPTGSGKTTTVYALLSEVNLGIEKIITIEDPVEYELPGVLQIPVNDKKGLTFAKGLRSILRHDPDRILVGEIRDAETATIAVQSALTGHQVLTTVHANSIYDVVGRFRHFGLDMYGFMSSLNGIVVQRLVRVTCPHCAQKRPAEQRERDWLKSMGQMAEVVPAVSGCDHCHGSGYRGRMVIAEVHAVDDSFRDLVTGGASLKALRGHVDGTGVESLQHQAAAMVVAGRTTLEEVKRVIGWR